MEQMKLIPADDMKDKLWGKRGTPEREAMENQLKEEVNAYFVGEAIRKARLAQKLTQEELVPRTTAKSKAPQQAGITTLQICLRGFPSPPSAVVSASLRKTRNT